MQTHKKINNPKTQTHALFSQHCISLVCWFY